MDSIVLLKVSSWIGIHTFNVFLGFMGKILFYSTAFLFLVSCKNMGSNADHPAYHNPLVEPYTFAIADEPDNAEWYYQRALALKEVDADSLCLLDLEKAVTLDTFNPDYVHVLGLQYLDLGKSRKAIAAFQKNLKLSPGEVRVRLLLSKAYLENGQIDSAQREVDKVLAAAPDYPDALYWQAEITVRRRDTLQAIEILNQALSIDPDYYLASYALADLYASQNSVRAIPQYEKTFEMDTMDVSPLFDIGKFFLQRHDLEKAKLAFVKSIFRDPDYSASYIEIGKILLKQDSFEKALRQFNIAIKTDPKDAEAYLYKGWCWEKLNEKDSARQAFDQALIFNPRLKAAEDAIERINQ